MSVLFAGELRDFVSAHSEWLSSEVPGFAEAMAWPDLPRVTSLAKAAGAARRRTRAYAKCFGAFGAPAVQTGMLRTETIFHPMEP